MSPNRNHVLMLRDIEHQSLSTLVTNGRAYVSVCEELVAMGLVSVHRSSIGELDERATYTITDAGRVVLAAGAR